MDTLSTPQSKQTVAALWRLQKIILDSLDFKQVVQKIVDSVAIELGYLNLGYRIIVLALANEEKQVLERISMSQTPAAEAVMGGSKWAFDEVIIPFSAKENFCIQTYYDQKTRIAYDWKDILSPPMSIEEARNLQKISGVKNSLVTPVIERGKCIGVLIFSLDKNEGEISAEEKDLISGFTEIVSLAIHDSHLYSDLGKITDQLQLANNRLRELDTLKSEFVSVASHELRTPMTAIKSYMWMALAGKGGNITDKQKYYLERAYISTDRLIKLVNDLLNVSRIESGRMSLDAQMISLGEFVDEVISEVKPRADELGIKIENTYDLAKPLPAVLADVDKIKEVMINLIGNGLKFTPQGGMIKIWFEESLGMVITHVQDNGEGISLEDIPKLFQKFGLVRGSYVTNQNAAQGTGLGLYISKSIVELSGGKMWVESEGHGKGATFSFSLPIFSQELMEEFQKKQEGKEGLGIIHSTID